VVLERKDGPGATLVHGEPGGWSVEKEQQSKAGVIQRFIDDLRELRGSSIAEEPPKNLKGFGLDAPDLRLTIVDREQKPMGTILLAKHDGKYYAMREGGPTVFEVRDYMYTRLDKQQRDFVGVEAPPSTVAPAPGPAGEMGEDEGANDEEE
jgi:hypothetical protein